LFVLFDGSIHATNDDFYIIQDISFQIKVIGLEQISTIQVINQCILIFSGQALHIKHCLAQKQNTTKNLGFEFTSCYSNCSTHSCFM